MTLNELYLLDLVRRVCEAAGVAIDPLHPAAGYVDEARAAVAHAREQLALTAAGRARIAAAEAAKGKEKPGK